jgi:hypothetical protein
LPCLTSSPLSHSFAIFCQLNNTTIWWGDFLLTYNAELHILHSSKREFLTTQLNLSTPYTSFLKKGILINLI